ncbi:MAG: hypothetical protein JO170_32205 [Verrucomicrobia bacterium]|nr:hypothetical protein [Verrucomicrobiota bacterium]
MNEHINAPAQNRRGYVIELATSHGAPSFSPYQLVDAFPALTAFPCVLIASPEG